MSLHAFLSLERFRKSLTGASAPLVGADNGRRPGEIFPNFTTPTTSGQMNFWDWAEGSWVYIFGLRGPFSASLDQLLSYAIAADVLDDAGVKVLGVSTMDHALLQSLSADVSAIAGRSLSATLVVDQAARLAQRLGLHGHEGVDGMPLHRSFLVGPDLRIKSIEVSATPIRRTCHQTLQLVASMQRVVPRTAGPTRQHDQWAELSAPQM